MPKVSLKEINGIYHLTWQKRIGTDPKTGRPRYRWYSKTASTDQKTAEYIRSKKQLSFDRAAGGLPVIEDTTWLQVCDRYLRDVAAKLTQPDGPKYALQDFNRRITIHKPAEFDADALDRYIDLCKDAGRSPVGVRRYMGVLRKVGRYIKRQRILQYNPAEGSKPVKGAKKTHHRHLSPAEVGIYLSKAKGKYLQFGQVGLYTGFRPGEILMTSWADVDFDRRTISVTPKPRYNWNPKDCETRTVRINPYLLDLLRQWKTTARHDLVICNKSGYPIAEKVMSRQFARLLRPLTKIPHLKPYVFRHTFAAQYLYRNPKGIYELSHILGHASVRTTQSHYEHLVTGYVAEGVDKVDYSR